MTHLLIMTTMPDIPAAEKLANGLVETSLAACVNILPAMQSIYRWKGDQQSDTEHQLLIKTRQQNYDAIEKYIKNHHPYELPEIIALPIQNGLPAYLSWVDESCENTI